jgi:prepilin-type N-terminal cleavage/methylation domain-containing protein
MKLSTRFNLAKKQAGLTLIELIASLAIMALVIGGALALYMSASTSQSTTQTIAEINAIRSSVKGLYYGQGGYGTANLNQVLVSGNKVPTTMIVTAGTPPVLTNSFNGAVTVTGATTTFTLGVTAIPTAICISLLSSANGWSSVKTAAVDHTTFPVSPSTAADDCSATNPIAMTFTSA